MLAVTLLGLINSFILSSIFRNVGDMRYIPINPDWPQDIKATLALSNAKTVQNYIGLVSNCSID